MILFYFVLRCGAPCSDLFLFYWVDGIFLKPTIPKKKLEQITGIFAEQGYYFKYEKVENCNIVRDGDKLLINMIKNGEEKPYQMYDKNLARNFTKVLQQLENAEQDPVHLSWNPTWNLQLSRRIS